VGGQRGFTLIELLIVIGVVGVLLSISMAGYHYARMRGAEASAVTSLEAINQAQFAYMQTCGNQRYAPSLAALGTPTPGTGTPYLSPDLTQATEKDSQGEQLLKSGYAIRMAGTEVVGRPAATGRLRDPVFRHERRTRSLRGFRHFQRQHARDGRAHTWGGDPVELT
jgi:prepilin-type N-terminal cleavage/methylation domain-containing protein